jgi:hypothetical protein
MSDTQAVVSRGRRRHSSPPRRRSREVIRRRSPSPRTEYKRRSGTPPIRSVRKRSRSRSRSKSARNSARAKKLVLSSSSSSSSSLSRERKRSKPKKVSVEKKSEQRKEDEKKEIVEKIDELGMEDEIPQVNDVEEEPPIVAEGAEVVVHQGGLEGAEEEGDGACRDCIRLLADLKGHVGEHHAESHAIVQKATIKAWFEAHYSRESPNAGEIASALLTRTTLLAEVNAFMVHMGWPKWKTQSPLYKDWFL